MKKHAHIDVTVTFVPEQRTDEFSRTQPHVVATTNVPSLGYFEARALHIDRAIDDIRRAIADALTKNGTKVSAYDIGLGRMTYRKFPAKDAAQFEARIHQAAINEDESRRIASDRAALAEELEGHLVSNGLPETAARAAHDKTGGVIVVEGESYWDVRARRTYTQFRTRRFRMRASGTYNWSKIVEAAREVYEWKTARTERLAKENKAAADAVVMVNELGINRHDPHVAITNTGYVRVTISTALPKKLAALAEFLKTEMGVDITTNE